MKRAATFVRRPVITASDLGFLMTLPADVRSDQDAPDWLPQTLPEAVARVEVAMIRRAIAEPMRRPHREPRNGSVSARQLLYWKLARYGLDQLPRMGHMSVPYNGKDAERNLQD